MPAARRLLCSWMFTLVATPVAALERPSDPAACLRGLAALDAEGRVLFETPALLTGNAGIATAPLHPLERGGVRWSRLELRSPDGAPGTSVVAVSPRPERDLTLLRVETADGCVSDPVDA